MNCPYCGKEMEPGMLTSVHELTWWKEGKRRKTSIYPPNQEGSVVLSEMSFLMVVLSKHTFAESVRR